MNQPDSQREAVQPGLLYVEPARVRIWTGNGRSVEALTAENAHDLIQSIENLGQTDAAVVRPLANDPHHDFELVAGVRRHFAVSWLRHHRLPDLKLLVQVKDLDDAAAFCVADAENLVRADITVIERARSYAHALQAYFGGHQSRMAEALGAHKTTLSKMLTAASISDELIAAFPPGEPQLKPAYALARALQDKSKVEGIKFKAEFITNQQRRRQTAGETPISAADVMRVLLPQPQSKKSSELPFCWTGPLGKTALCVTEQGRSGITLEVYADSGADEEHLVKIFRQALFRFLEGQ